MQDDIALLRERGQRLTPQRMMVLDIIKQHHGHLTAEEIHHHSQSQQPYLNIATVYRTLQWLQAQGLVHTLHLENDRTYYEYHNSSAHHHLVCTRCHTVAEITAAGLQTLIEHLQHQHGFVAHIEHLAVPGICRACHMRDLA